MRDNFYFLHPEIRNQFLWRQVNQDECQISTFFLSKPNQMSIQSKPLTSFDSVLSVNAWLWLLYIFIYLFISNGVDRREWRNLKTVTEKSDFVSRAAMRDEISDGGCACVCTLSGEACVGTASSHFKNVCVAGATSQVTFHPSGELSCTGNILTFRLKYLKIVKTR